MSDTLTEAPEVGTDTEMVGTVAAPPVTNRRVTKWDTFFTKMRSAPGVWHYMKAAVTEGSARQRTMEINNRKGLFDARMHEDETWEAKAGPLPGHQASDKKNWTVYVRLAESVEVADIGDDGDDDE